MVDGVEVYPASHIKDVLLHIKNEKPIKAVKYNFDEEVKYEYNIDFSDVKGQDQAKRALGNCCGRQGIIACLLGLRVRVNQCLQKDCLQFCLI